MPTLKEPIVELLEPKHEIGGLDLGLHCVGAQPAKETRLDFRITVPFEGDAFFFWIKPSRYTSSTPQGTIEGGSLYLRVPYESGTNTAKIRERFDEQLDPIKACLEQLRIDASNFNVHFSKMIHELVGARRQELLVAQSIVSELGFKIKPRDDDFRTYAAPEVRRRIVPTLPPASFEPYEPEPYLNDSDYEHILGVIHDMTMVMERAPSAFVSMNEEAIRWLYLVALNGHYEGQATGETFNYHGKTDILVRSKGKNIFIAECKFWKGQEKMREAIDQLLGYSSWRDTKVALIVFNRNKGFTNVLTSLDETTRKHSNFKRSLGNQSETSFRYIFAHSDDPNREMILTVIAFDVPTGEDI